MIPAIIAGAAALASAAGSIYSASQSAKQSARAAAQKQANIEKAGNIVNGAYDDIDDLLAAYKDKVDANKITDDSTLATYKRLVNSYDPSDYIAERGTFDKGAYNVEDYINENRDAIVKDVSDTVSRSQAGAGVGRGTGAANAIAKAVAEKDEELYNNAYERMKDDRDFDYNEFEAQYAANQSALTALNQGVQTQMSVLGGAIQQDQQNEADYLADYISSKSGRAQAQANLLT